MSEMPAADVAEKEERWEDTLAGFEATLRAAPDDVEALCQMANLLDTLERPEEALPLFQRAVELEPESPDIWNALGCVLRELDREADGGDHTGSPLHAFRRAADLDPEHVCARLNIALTLRNAGNPEQARVWAHAALDLDPTHAGCRYELGAICEAEGLLEEAVEHYRAAADLDPDWNLPWSSAAQVLHELGQCEAAILLYRRLLAQGDDAEECYNLGLALADHGEHEEALAAYECSARLGLDDLDLWMSRGIVLDHLARYAEAREAYREALQRAPDDVRIRRNLGVSCAWAGDDHAAAEHYTKAVELAPDRADLWTYLGAAHRRLDRLPEARLAIERAVALDPLSGEAWYELGVLLEAVGEPAGARAAWERAATLSDHEAAE